MHDLSMIERQLERYRRLLYGATDSLLIEGLRKIIEELEVKRAACLPPSLGRDEDAGDQPDLSLPAS